MEYLREEKYYIDLHDLGTVKDCLHHSRLLYSKLPELLKLPNKENLTEEKLKNDWLRAINIVVYSIKTERFRSKEKTITDWMSSDKEKQTRFDKAEPLEIYCDGCNLLMEPFDKTLIDDFKGNIRILFLYGCPNCTKKKAYYDNGEIHKSKLVLCEKCGGEIRVSIKPDNKDNVTTWIYKCTSCDYIKTEIDDHKKWWDEHNDRERKDKELLAKYRDEFCFSEQEGNEAVQQTDAIITFMKELEEEDKKKKDPLYQKARSIKKLKVTELNKLLKEELEKAGYTELMFEKPEMGRFVAIPFLVQDEKTDRADYDSKQGLKRLINKVLADTNWRLMSGGIGYRAGYLSGKLRCYEHEEELVEILKE